MMNWDYSGYGMPFFGMGGGLFMIIWWVFIVGCIVMMMKGMMNQGKMHHGGTSALNVLKERYAKGEINKQEFEEKKKDIL